MNRSILILTELALIFLSSFAYADNWPNWRGPSSNGVANGKGYPTEWGENENIIWKIKVAGWGTSSPAIWESRIFVTGEDAEKNTLVCLNRDGKKSWQVSFGASAGNRNRKASGANPSPATDGTHVYAYFRNGDLACVDFDGKIVWQTNLQQKHGSDRLNWDLGTSPVLTSKLVVVAVMHAGPSYLLALDKKTGNEAWKQNRDLGAPAEARDSYSTPIVVERGGEERLVVLGADHVTVYKAETGQEVWRAGGLNPDRRRNFRSIASPVISNGMVIAPYARGDTLTSFRMGGNGDVSKSHLAWTAYESSADVPTPAAQGQHVYVCGDRGDVSCVDADTGQKVWTKRLPRNRSPYSSSPIIADGKLYATREDGTTFVLQLGEDPELISTNKLRENTYATPVFVDGQVFLRTSEFLFCIGEKK